jgi:hypothetical protein
MPTALLLLAISHTLLLLLGVLPVLYARPLARAGLKFAFLPIASTVSASLAGLLGLVALGTGSRGTAVIGGVLGTVSLALRASFLPLIATVFARFGVEGGGKLKPRLADTTLSQSICTS